MQAEKLIMGDPPAPHSGGAAQAPASANGILAYVGGQYIAQASQQLPRAQESEKSQPMREVVLTDVPDLGTVRITFKLDWYKHGRSRHWHWLAVHAVREE